MLGLSQAPGDVGGFGPVDAATAADLTALAAADPATRWCLTLTGPNGEAIGHGCAPPGRAPSSRAPSGRARPPDGTPPGHPGPQTPGTPGRPGSIPGTPGSPCAPGSPGTPGSRGAGGADAGGGGPGRWRLALDIEPLAPSRGGAAGPRARLPATCIRR